MSTLHNWEKKELIYDLMLKNNFCCFELSSGNNTPFYSYDNPGATCDDAINELRNQLDCISEGLLTVCVGINKKSLSTKKNCSIFNFKISSLQVVNNAISGVGIPKDFVTEKIEFALFKQQTELNNKHRDELTKVQQEKNELLIKSNSNLFDRLYSYLESKPELAMMAIGKIESWITNKPIANIAGTNDQVLNKIYQYIPEPAFNSLLQMLSDALEKDKDGTIKKLQSVFKNG